ncbi:heterogeneous nuclear ribonucleoprotein C-like 2 [Choloepus didactylus]|uniref:heterogeneous nuclear ribonucleoprotein C-like 2 n=1 Tax=Choloepus didactylus TaxID=27675 RepID=UPI00189DC1A0|nr:heterogeneous nuclear ribonucleoprotein C-like 2 [Choloepus didactylus]
MSLTVRTEELCSIRGELTQIKAQVDSLLEHLERMDQQGDQPAVQPLPGGGPGIKDSETRDSGAEGSSGTATESHQESRSKEKAEPRTQRALPEEDSLEEGRDMKLAVKSHASDWEGSQ